MWRGVLGGRRGVFHGGFKWTCDGMEEWSHGGAPVGMLDPDRVVVAEAGGGGWGGPPYPNIYTSK